MLVIDVTITIQWPISDDRYNSTCLPLFNRLVSQNAYATSILVSFVHHPLYSMHPRLIYNNATLRPKHPNLLPDPLPTNRTSSSSPRPRPIVLHRRAVLLRTPLAHDQVAARKTSHLRRLRVANTALELERHLLVCLGLRAATISRIETLLLVFLLLLGMGRTLCAARAGAPISLMMLLRAVVATAEV
jgi:hypothetical protein